MEQEVDAPHASGSSMTSRTAARLAWGIALLSYAIVAACLVLLWLERATIGSVGAGPVGNVVPAATLGVLAARLGAVDSLAAKLDRDPGPGSIDPDLPAVPRREAP